ncbi:MAG: hypothetical protein BWY95_01562 [Bacteroidetes bacterium ADurb.BinA104]|nr:MAG: hypothetical protein BWY95_01562 [Bacteroidetes bacterium ADurb.BinA104]
MLLGRYLDQFIPIGSLLLHFGCIGIERDHGKSLTRLGMARTDIGTVAATQTVKYRRLNDKVHAPHCGRCLHLNAVNVVKALQLVIGQNKRTYGSVRTDIGTLITLYAIILFPDGNECLDTTLLVCSRTDHP